MAAVQRLGIGVLVALAVAPSVADAAVSAAQGDALAWLATVDRGAYADSWSQAGTIFRSNVTEADWAHKIGLARDPLGAIVSRSFASEEMRTALPGAPDGQYAILRFATVFAHKQSAVETVILAKEGLSWKVDGYFIK